jgi:hypothetical protein
MEWVIVAVEMARITEWIRFISRLNRRLQKALSMRNEFAADQEVCPTETRPLICHQMREILRESMLCVLIERFERSGVLSSLRLTWRIAMTRVEEQINSTTFFAFVGSDSAYATFFHNERHYWRSVMIEEKLCFWSCVDVVELERSLRGNVRYEDKAKSIWRWKKTESCQASGSSWSSGDQLNSDWTLARPSTHSASFFKPQDSTKDPLNRSCTSALTIIHSQQHNIVRYSSFDRCSFHRQFYSSQFSSRWKAARLKNNSKFKANFRLRCHWNSSLARNYQWNRNLPELKPTKILTRLISRPWESAKFRSKRTRHTHELVDKSNFVLATSLSFFPLRFMKFLRFTFLHSERVSRISGLVVCNALRGAR